MSFIFSPLPHEEAVSRIAGLPLVSRAVMDEMLPELRAYAFTITGLDVGDQMAKVRDMIQAVPAGEKTWEKARKEIAAELVDDLGGGKASARRAELLLRTHVFRGYAASRYRRLMQQADVFPFWQYRTHGDGNVRPSHAALNGKIFPAGHQIWQRIFPPWDWGCRCLVVPLTQRGADQILARGKISDQAAKDANLLPTQIAKPEMFTDAEAALIDKNQRLPDGKPLNRTPTWADAPWSIPGNIQHDWPLIKARYDDQPEVLKAFEKWAKKTKIAPKLTVSQWLGVVPKKRVKKALEVVAAKVAQAEFPATVEGLKLVKKLGGSTGAELVEDAAGNRYVRKAGASADHLREEVLADDLYRALGAPVPEAKLYETDNGPVKLARFIGGDTLGAYMAKATPAQREAVYAKLGEHFHADVLLGNWDVIGLGKDNVLVDAAGLPWRIDNGGSLRFRAMGAPKNEAWNEFPDELWTLRDAATNAQTAEVFGKLPLMQIAQRVEAASLPDLAAPAEVKAMLAARWKHLSELSTKALDMQHDGWRDGYGEDLCRHILGLRKAGISADLPKELKQAAGAVDVVDENGKLWDDLRATKTKAAAATPADAYWTDILGAVKTLNNHAAKGDFNFTESTVLAATKHKFALEKLAKGKGDSAKMAKHYLGHIAHIEAGVTNSKAKQAFTLPQLNAWAAPVKKAKKQSKAGSLVERLRDYVAANGGDYRAVSAWKSDQAGDSWEPDAQAKKVWVAKHLDIPAAKTYWQGLNQTATAEAHFINMEKRFGAAQVDTAFTIHHAFVQELLAGTDLRHNDRARRVLRILRTEDKSVLGYYGLKPGADAEVPRGLCESGSVFAPFRYKGTEITIQSVPHTRVLGSYLMEKNPGAGDVGFAGNHENEFTFVAAAQPFHYQGTWGQVTVNVAAGNDASAWGVPTQHLRQKP